MKQLLFSLFVFTNCILLYSFQPTIKNASAVQKVLVSNHEKKLYVFYENHISRFDLNNFETEDILFDNQLFDLNEYGVYNDGEHNYFLHSQGGGVLLFQNDSLFRVDNSYEHKMQINSSIFSHNGKVYKYGGYGFWSHRNFITEFDSETREWEFVPFSESDKYPRGRQDAIAKVIGDYVYIFGGTAMDEKNGMLKYHLNDIWKFDLVNRIWTKLGTVNLKLDGLSQLPRVDFEESVLFSNEIEDVILKINFKTNEIETYGRNSILRKIFSWKGDKRFQMFYLQKKFYGFFKSNNELDQLDLVARNSDEIFGNLISKKKFYESEDKFSRNLIFFFPLLVLIIFIIYQIDKERIKSKKIIFQKGELYYKGQRIEMEPLSIKVLKHFINSEDTVSSSQIMDWINKPQLDYSYRTRMINETLYKINYSIKNVLKIDYEVISVKKSSLDKRLKVYTIDKTLFSGYPIIKKEIDV